MNDNFVRVFNNLDNIRNPLDIQKVFDIWYYPALFIIQPDSQILLIRMYQIVKLSDIAYSDRI